MIKKIICFCVLINSTFISLQAANKKPRTNSEGVRGFIDEIINRDGFDSAKDILKQKYINSQDFLQLIIQYGKLDIDKKCKAKFDIELKDVNNQVLKNILFSLFNLEEIQLDRVILKEENKCFFSLENNENNNKENKNNAIFCGINFIKGNIEGYYNPYFVCQYFYLNLDLFFSKIMSESNQISLELEEWVFNWKEDNLKISKNNNKKIDVEMSGDQLKKEAMSVIKSLLSIKYENNEHFKKLSKDQYYITILERVLELSSQNGISVDCTIVGENQKNIDCIVIASQKYTIDSLGLNYNGKNIYLSGMSKDQQKEIPKNSTKNITIDVQGADLKLLEGWIYNNLDKIALIEEVLSTFSKQVIFTLESKSFIWNNDALQVYFIGNFQGSNIRNKELLLIGSDIPRRAISRVIENINEIEEEYKKIIKKNPLSKLIGKLYYKELNQKEGISLLWELQNKSIK